MDAALEELNPLDRLGQLFELDADQVQALAAMLEDPTCWLLTEDFPGTTIIRVPAVVPETTTLYLSCTPAGALWGEHGHRGRETVLVLRGRLREIGGSGRAIGPGEHIVAEPGVVHAFEIPPSSDCICAVRVDFAKGSKRRWLDTGLA